MLSTHNSASFIFKTNRDNSVTRKIEDPFEGKKSYGKI